MSQHWPAAELDPVRRLRVIAAATPGAIYAEEHIPAPFDAVWAVVSDLEAEVPRIITDVATFTVTASDPGFYFEARARSRLGLRARFDVVLRPGWCLMQSRFLVFGMAAVPEAGGTRFAGTGRAAPPRGPAARPSQPVAAHPPTSPRRHRPPRRARPVTLTGDPDGLQLAQVKALQPSVPNAAAPGSRRFLSSSLPLFLSPLSPQPSLVSSESPTPVQGAPEPSAACGHIGLPTRPGLGRDYVTERETLQRRLSVLTARDILILRDLRLLGCLMTIAPRSVSGPFHFPRPGATRPAANPRCTAGRLA